MLLTVDSFYTLCGFQFCPYRWKTQESEDNTVRGHYMLDERAGSKTAIKIAFNPLVNYDLKGMFIKL